MKRDDREYRRSHPWLTFDVDRQLRDAPVQLWQLLGGVVALADVLADTPLLPAVAREMHAVYLAKGALATTAIEGNTLTEEEVRKAMDRQLRLPPSKEYLETEVLNMVEAFNEIMRDVEPGTPPLTVDRIKEMNRQVLKSLELDPGVVPGEVSDEGVVVGTYRGAPRRDCEYLLDRLCTWLEPDKVETVENRTANAILRALLAHLYLAWIHPFGDGNGRTARLVEFMLLAHGGIPATAAHLLSNHFNDTRTAYYRQLAHASRSGGDVVRFLIYALQGFYDGLRTQLDRIRQQTEDLVWQELVHQAIPGAGHPAHRQRRLATDLFKSRTAVPKGQLTALSLKLFNMHHNTSVKTLTRDVHVLEAKGLMRRTPDGYVASEEKILGLMPARAPQPIGQVD